MKETRQLEINGEKLIATIRWVDWESNLNSSPPRWNDRTCGYYDDYNQRHSSLEDAIRQTLANNRQRYVSDYLVINGTSALRIRLGHDKIINVVPID